MSSTTSLWPFHGVVGRPGSFATILGMFAGDMDDIEAENGYTIDALVIGIHAFSAAAG